MRLSSHMCAASFPKSSCARLLKESPGEFRARMLKVEKYMNYEMGKHGKGQALLELGDSLHQRSELLKQLVGERLPK